ncbi:ribonuclease P protein subunit p38 [Antennarius striatus]|uniref:ribonuclease P protein subunit p38 n=1 Tax=Antennarius striatus TaxID=241820 RepID=UPI0035B406C0
MDTPRKPFKKEIRKHVPTKTSFTSPFTPKWGPLPQEDMHFILNILKDKLISTGLQKREVKGVHRRRKKTDNNSGTTSDPALKGSPDAKVQDSSKNGWTNVTARGQLAIGINEVTKGLERNELKLLLVCKSVKPIHMTNHLMELSATRNVPACQVPRLSQSLSEPLGLRSVLALGFRRCASTENELFSDIVDAITPRVPPLDVAWLQSAEPSASPKICVGMGEEIKEKRGSKRKLETGQSKPVKRSDPFITLQPLKVKRIVANSARKRRKAKSYLVR